MELYTVKEIQLTQNRVAYVDDDDYESLAGFNWSVSSGGYAKCYLGGGRKNQTFTYMHRQILNPPDDFQIDHINGNRLDNRKENLRVCAPKDNSRNRNGWKLSRKTSKYKGVYWSKSDNVWISGITVDGRFMHLGRFHDEAEAARVYDAAAIKYFKKFAKSNAYGNEIQKSGNIEIQEKHACSSLNSENKTCKLTGRFYISGKWWCPYHRPDKK